MNNAVDTVHAQRGKLCICAGCEDEAEETGHGPADSDSCGLRSAYHRGDVMFLVGVYGESFLDPRHCLFVYQIEGTLLVQHEHVICSHHAFLQRSHVDEGTMNKSSDGDVGASVGQE